MLSQEIRCFIAIDVEDSEILTKVSKVQQLLRDSGADLKIVDNGIVHVTLKFLGDVEREKVPELEAALRSVRFSPFMLELKGVGAFPSLNRINVIWIGIGTGEKEVARIYDQIQERTVSLGFRREDRNFNAHITIARARSPRKKEELGRLLKDVAEQSFGSFLSDKIRLKRSVLKHSGPEYTTLFETLASEVVVDTAVSDPAR